MNDSEGGDSCSTASRGRYSGSYGFIDGGNRTATGSKGRGASRGRSTVSCYALGTHGGNDRRSGWTFAKARVNDANRCRGASTGVWRRSSSSNWSGRGGQACSKTVSRCYWRRSSGVCTTTRYSNGSTGKTRCSGYSSGHGFTSSS